VSSLYAEAISIARRRGYRLSRIALAQIIAAFEQAARRIEFDLQASNQPLTRERAASLRDQLNGTLRELEIRTSQTTYRAVRLTVDDVAEIHEDVLARILHQRGGQLRMLDQFARIPARAVAVLAARAEVGGGAAGFRSLMKYHTAQAAPELDRLIQSGLARGLSTRKLTQDVAAFLATGQADVSAYGLESRDVSKLGEMQYDAKRIAVSETLNALREATAMALDGSIVVDAVQWQVSGRHAGLPSSPDECDILAEADLYGLGPGWYPPSRIPVAPHPFCGCTTGGTRLRHPSQWDKPRPAAPGLAIDWASFDPASHVSRAEGWSEKRRERAVTALRRSLLDPIGRRARRVA
jgi:hypothetical protein